jgi:hypothetical protein
MLTTTANAPHVYVACDVPEGMTLAEWRRAHSAAEPSRFARHPVRHLMRRRPTTG